MKSERNKIAEKKKKESECECERRESGLSELAVYYVKTADYKERG